MTTDKNQLTNEEFSYDSKNDEKHHEEHEYDGIKELDNPPPHWIMAVFVITIAFSIVYGMHYIWFGYGDNQDEEYNKEIALTTTSDTLNAAADVLLTDKESLAEGKEIFGKLCMACHGIDGGGTVGPNLTDKNWIYGCDFKALTKIINNGSPTGTMTPFKSQLSSKQIQKVTSYILEELVGTSPANPKPAQGEVCK